MTGGGRPTSGDGLGVGVGGGVGGSVGGGVGAGLGAGAANGVAGTAAVGVACEGRGLGASALETLHAAKTSAKAIARQQAAWRAQIGTNIALRDYTSLGNGSTRPLRSAINSVLTMIQRQSLPLVAAP